MIAEKDSENKRFLAWTATTVSVVGTTALAIGSALLGNNTSLNKHNDDDADDNDMSEN